MHNITPAQLAELLTTSDRAMQRKYGVSANTWSRRRRDADIPPFRPPTVTDGAPSPWRVPEPKKTKPRADWDNFKQPTIVQTGVPADHSLTGEAASFLRRERFHVFDRAKIGEGEGWQVGRSVLSAADMVEKACRMGFQRQTWMGGF